MISNLAILEIEDGAVEVEVLPRYDRELHRRLEAQYWRTHVFRRRRDALEAVRLVAEAESVSETKETRSLRKLGGLLDSLVEEALVRHISSLSAKTKILRRRPLAFVSMEPKNDVANVLFRRKIQSAVLPFHARRGFRLESRSVRAAGDWRRCVSFDATTTSQIDATCADLLADGVDIVGLYAAVEEAVVDKRCAPKRTLVGIIKSVDGMTVSLGGDRRDEASEFDAAKLWLDPGPAAIARLATHYVGAEASELLFEERGQLAGGKARFKRIDDLRSKLSAVRLELAPNAGARLREWVAAEELGVAALPRPRFVVGGGRVVEAAKDVLRAGPNFTPATLAEGTSWACAICDDNHRGKIETFLTSLRDGLGAHRSIAQTWKVKDLHFKAFVAKDKSPDAYEEACRRALDDRADWRIAFVQLPDGTAELVGDANPYLVTKAKFLARGIPVQEFRNETMMKPEAQRQWALGAIALQSFAKLGGVPWLLQTDVRRGHEVVLGLGSAQVGTGRFGDRERIVGLTTAFSADGTYWLTESSRTVKFADHEAAVGATAVAAIRRVREEMAWQAGDAVRLVFHSFKDFSGVHVESIKEAVAGLTTEGFSVDTAFVHVAKAHPLLLFDPAVDSRIPARGQMVRLNDFEALVTLLGPDEVKDEDAGFPRPLLLKVQRGSTFDKLDYLTAQALAFSAHSWRNFSPTSLPVTILYSELIAGLLGRLGNLSRWDSDVLRGEVGKTRWFL